MGLQFAIITKWNMAEKGIEFYSGSMKSFLQNNDIMHSTYNEVKSVIAESSLGP